MSTTAVAVREDQLVPVGDVRALVARMGAAQPREISSIHGHDAYLREADQLRDLLIAAIRENAMSVASDAGVHARQSE